MDQDKPQDATSKMDRKLSSRHKGHIRKGHPVWLGLRLIDSILFATLEINITPSALGSFRFR
jgi:hypothetical protein